MDRAGVIGAGLNELLAGLVQVVPEQDRRIEGLALHSDAVAPGSLFFACSGAHARGHEYIGAAIAAGAAAVLYEERLEVEVRAILAAVTAPGAPPVAYAVPDVRGHVGIVADRFYGHPSHELHVIGVTGTNGKTSCTQFLAQALDESDQPCGVIGTLGTGLVGRLAEGRLTTPDALSVQRSIAELRQSGASHVVMEVSSHALDQGRVNGVSFDAAVFTNLTHDHLDYHGDMAAYGLAKSRLFQAPGLRFAIVNIDDSFGRRLPEVIPTGITVVGYTLDRAAIDFAALGRDVVPVAGRIVGHDRTGMAIDVFTPWGEGRLRSSVIGRFNASNLLAALATLLVMGIPFQEAITRLGRVTTVPGRMELFTRAAAPLVIVDYAHTPDALETALCSVREHCVGRLWCVFGCGGDRDRGKRPLMGQIAERYADRVVLTNDNPRSESPESIITEISAGMRDPARAIVCHDRKEAIAYAITHADAEDAVLIAGKGHEAYQIVGDTRLSFSDRDTVRALLK